MSRIRPAAFAGKFYPEEENKLQESIDTYLKEAKKTKIEPEVKALISPHAGYPYSGPIAASGYKTIEKDYSKVILIGPSHNIMFSGIGLTNFSFWRTPLGLVTSSKLIEKLKEEYNFNMLNEAHTFEHSIEVQLPFLQTILEDFKIIPLATGRVNSHKEIANVLNRYLDEKTLIVVSSDLSHYLSYSEAEQKDKKTIEKILSFETDFDRQAACGIDGIKIVLEIAKLKKWKPKLIEYKNSKDTAGDREKVVGYTSIAFLNSEK